MLLYLVMQCIHLCTRVVFKMDACVFISKQGGTFIYVLLWIFVQEMCCAKLEKYIEMFCILFFVWD